MDVGDVDGDGDEDIVIGSLAPENERDSSTRSGKSKVLFLLLENKTK
jgi:hypothetical protein